MADPERPYITLGKSDRDPDEERHDAVELLVRDVLSRLSGELMQAVLDRSKDVVPVAARQVMDKVYRPLPSKLRLMGQAEIVAFFGMKHRQQFADLRAHKSHPFPDPVAELKMGPVWRAEDVEEWAKGWDRRPGRPRKKKETPGD